MNDKYRIKHKGFTLIGLLIVFLVIGVLAAMMMMSSTESIATAKAAKIISDLQILKRAVIAWYSDNYDKVVKSNGKVDGKDAIAGMVVINGKPHPIQECQDSDLQLSKYISKMDSSGIQLTHRGKNADPRTGLINTELEKGYYGVYDGGTVRDDNDKNKITEYRRSTWYVGYRFKDDEGAVREKIIGNEKSAGVFLGTADAHKDNVNDNNAAVWMRVL